MPYALKTLGDCLQSLADRHDAGTLPTSSSTISYWTRLINKAQNYCADRLRLLKTTTLTTVSGVIDFPDDFMVISNVVDSDNRSWSLIPSDESENAFGTVYWITGNQVDGFTLNIPSGTDYAFTVYYSFRPAEMSANADVCVITDIEAVVSRAYGMLRMAETDPLEDADKSFGECDRRLSEIEMQKNSNEGGMSFTLQENA